MKADRCFLSVGCVCFLRVRVEPLRTPVEHSHHPFANRSYSSVVSAVKVERHNVPGGWHNVDVFSKAREGINGASYR